MICIYGFGINADNYTYYLRDALPALLFFAAFMAAFVTTVRRPGTRSRTLCAILVAGAVIHFAIDERLHQFTIQMLTLDRGCVWQSPTWWWHEHRCSGWWAG